MTSQQRVLITGSAAGIGRAIAYRCRQDGYEVVGIDRDESDIRADLSDPQATTLDAVMGRRFE
ncbi:SDR family NAD(P)-dependent oxidoreductase [Bosea sp. 2RAB26]|uniref:SDR family NAD(P)-dependent oxidoreductase n=1 Tax=Bosea sp. 2RAB26 TaxID=3237476 RepID=UPI003F90B686